MSRFSKLAKALSLLAPSARLNKSMRASLWQQAKTRISSLMTRGGTGYTRSTFVAACHEQWWVVFHSFSATWLQCRTLRQRSVFLRQNRGRNATRLHHEKGLFRVSQSLYVLISANLTDAGVTFCRRNASAVVCEAEATQHRWDGADVIGQRNTW